MGRSIRDLSGVVIGRLTAQWPVGLRGKHRLVVWMCLCECGRLKTVTRESFLRGFVRSCGCLRPQGKRHRVNPRTPEYQSWQAMKSRCLLKTNGHYPLYGAMGISVSDRWKDSFANFLADMGPRPTGTTLDRWPNPHGNYEPGNCRWATPNEQAKNRRFHNHKKMVSS